MDIKLQPVGHVQQAQAAVPEQAEKLPSYSERYYDDYFEYRCEQSQVARVVFHTRNPFARSLTKGHCRHVSLTMEQAQRLPKPMRILNEVCPCESFAMVNSRKLTSFRSTSLADICEHVQPPGICGKAFIPNSVCLPVYCRCRSSGGAWECSNPRVGYIMPCTGPNRMFFCSGVPLNYFGKNRIWCDILFHSSRL
jgi:hypothetical protein